MHESMHSHKVEILFAKQVQDILTRLTEKKKRHLKNLL